jgi:hypothetical protein
MIQTRHLLAARRRYRILNDTPSFAALTVVAPGVRFNALAILVTPALAFAIIFNVRMSSLVQRRIAFFFFLANFGSFFCEPGF